MKEQEQQNINTTTNSNSSRRRIDQVSTERLRRAETLEDIKDGLGVDPYVWDGSARELEVYGEYLGAVVEKVFGSAGCWECLVPDERRRLVDSVLGSPVNGDAALVCLERAAAEGTDGVARAVEQYFVERPGIGAAFCALCVRADCDAGSVERRWTAAVGAVCGLPWVLSNMHQGKIPRELRPERFIASAVRQCVEGLWTLDSRARAQGTMLAGVLIGKAEGVGMSNVVAQTVVKSLVHRCEKEEEEEEVSREDDGSDCLQEVMCAVGAGSGGGEGLLWAFLDEVERSKANRARKEAWAREAVAGRVAGGGETAKRAIVGRFVCVRGREETLDILVTALSSLGLLRDAARNAVNAWSETFFISHAGPDLDSCKY